MVNNLNTRLSLVNTLYTRLSLVNNLKAAEVRQLHQGDQGGAAGGPGRSVSSQDPSKRNDAAPLWSIQTLVLASDWFMDKCTVNKQVFSAGGD